MGPPQHPRTVNWCVTSGRQVNDLGDTNPRIEVSLIVFNPMEVWQPASASTVSTEKEA